LITLTLNLHLILNNLISNLDFVVSTLVSALMLNTLMSVSFVPVVVCPIPVLILTKKKQETYRIALYV
jgi:hypothetical protein